MHPAPRTLPFAKAIGVAALAYVAIIATLIAAHVPPPPISTIQRTVIVEIR